MSNERRPTFQGRELSDDDLELLRAQVEMVDSIDQIDPEIRDIVAERWPELISRIAPEKKQ
jgi:hypothetical protein